MTRRLLRGQDGRAWLIAAVVLIVSFLTLYPLMTLALGSFRSAPPGAEGHFTLDGFREVYTDPSTFRTLWDSLIIALASSFLATSLGLLLAWITARTNTPGRGTLLWLLAVPLFIPPVLKTLAWATMLNPRTGTINVVLVDVLGLNSAPFNIYSYGGIIWVLGLGGTSFVYLMTVYTFKTMDPALEEVSRVVGAGGFTTFFRVTLPLMAPAVTGVAILNFMKMLEAFEAPVFLGIPARIYVFTSKIFDTMVLTQPPSYAQASALAVMLMVIGVILVSLQWKLLGGKSFFTVTGRGYQARVIDVGRWRILFLLVCLGYLTVSTLLPMGQLLIGSFSKILGIYSPGMWTLDNYRTIFVDPFIWRAVRNTVFLAVVGGFFCSSLSSAVAYLIVRARVPGTRVLDLISWLPWTIPGIVLAVALLWAYTLLPVPLYGTLWILLIAYITLGLPVGVRIMCGAYAQISQELEESSVVHGASWMYTFGRILLPLTKSSFLAGWVLLAVLFSRELSASALLYVHGTEVLSVAIMNFWDNGQSEVVCALGVLLLLVVLVTMLLVRVLMPRRERDDLAA